jgi:thiol-disulfide isomerase/thioredoxin
LPHLQKIADAYKAAGLEVLAVNAGDAEEKIQQYFRSQGLSLKSTIGAAAGAGSSPSPHEVLGQYGVRAFPTNYLVDKDGKVAWRGVGFDEKALRDALNALGLRAASASSR